MAARIYPVNFPSAMAEFYKELKALREQKQIDLEEIHKKTKINLDYLRAIEDGQFDILPKPYIRLFLKAYTIEIGGEPEKSLNQLEQMLAARDNKPVSKPAAAQTAIPDIEHEEPIQPDSRSPKKVRSDITKGLSLLAIFLFAIFIIRKINTEKTLLTIDETGPVETVQEDFLTENDLMHLFAWESSDEGKLETEPPFEVKISSIDKLLYSVKSDQNALDYKTMAAGDYHIHPFANELMILLKKSDGINIQISGESKPTLKDHSHPVRVYFNADSSSQTWKTEYFVPK